MPSRVQLQRLNNKGRRCGRGPGGRSWGAPTDVLCDVSDSGSLSTSEDVVDCKVLATAGLGPLTLDPRSASGRGSPLPVGSVVGASVLSPGDALPVVVAVPAAQVGLGPFSAGPQAVAGACGRRALEPLVVGARSRAAGLGETSASADSGSEFDDGCDPLGQVQIGGHEGVTRMLGPPAVAGPAIVAGYRHGRREVVAGDVVVRGVLRSPPNLKVV